MSEKKPKDNILNEIFDEVELDLLKELITEYRNVQNVKQNLKVIHDKIKALQILSSDPSDD